MLIPPAVPPTEAEIALGIVPVETRDVAAATDLGDRAERNDGELPLRFRESRSES